MLINKMNSGAWKSGEKQVIIILSIMDTQKNDLLKKS